MRVIDSTYLEKNPQFLSVRKDKIKLADQSIIDGYLVVESKHWVNAVVLTRDLEIILVEQYRHGIENTSLEIPAGAMETGETPEEAILREVLEETGYASAHPPIFLGDYFVNPANFNNKIYSYLIMDAELVSDQQLDKTEEIDIIQYPFDKIDTLINNHRLKQLFSSHSILLAKKC